MRKRLTTLSLFATALLAIFQISACLAAEDEAARVAEEVATDVEWFRDAKFGMFIHWGLYSHTGGVWDGKRYYGITEWLMRRGKIMSDDYKQIADEFNPVDFDAKEWVATAKAAGIRYIVITSKHHDGFALFESEASDFNIVDATPYGKDPIRALVEEAHAADIKIGFYYSQYQDWTEEDAAGNEWEFDPDAKNFDRYLTSKAMPQLSELLTNYGPIDIIWFDTPGDLSKEDAARLKAWVKEVQPNCIVSDRIGHDLGDFKGYRDGEVPAVPQSGRPWEAIFTHNDSWGYSLFDQNFKSTSEVLQLLIRVAGKGGNLMLNIGPDGTGKFPPESTRVFEQIGQWLDTNGESIYGTSASPVGAMPWGATTSTSGKLYLHVFRRPDDGRLLVPEFGAEVLRASLLANGTDVAFEQNGTDLEVALPNELPDARVNVVVIEYPPRDEASIGRRAEILVSPTYGATILDASEADLSEGLWIEKYSTMHYFGDWQHYFTIDGLNSPDVAASWTIRVLEAGSYRVSLNYSASAAEAGQEGALVVGDDEYFFKVLETGEFNDPGGYEKRKPIMFIDHPVAVLTFDQPGIHQIRLGADQLNANLMKLQHITIERHD